MRRTAGKTENQSDQVPTNGTHQSGEQDLLVYHLEMYKPRANRFGDGCSEDESRDEIPKCGPHDGAKWRENTSGDDGRDRIGGVVPAVGKFEGQSQHNHGYYQMEGVHGSGALQNDAFNDVGNIFTFVDRR